jgi:hypothetical protein
MECVGHNKGPLDANALSDSIEAGSFLTPPTPSSHNEPYNERFAPRRPELVPNNDGQQYIPFVRGLAPELLYVDQASGGIASLWF